MASYAVKAVIESLPEEYRGTVTSGASVATVGGASIPGELVVALYGEGTAYTGSFYIDQTESTRLSLTNQTGEVTLDLGGTETTVRLIGQQPFAGGLTRWDFGPTL